MATQQMTLRVVCESAAEWAALLDALAANSIEILEQDDPLKTLVARWPVATLDLLG